MKHKPSCCHIEEKPPEHEGPNCHIGAKHGIDYILWGSLAVIVPSYLFQLFFPEQISEVPYISVLSSSSYEMINQMWLGVVIGTIFVGLLSKIPREIISSILGKGGTFSGILRATFAGVLIDMCSHGLLLVGAKLYERGASIGQLMAFLIASPWNSFSLLVILWSLIGAKWTIIFLLMSMIIALISGYIFDLLVKKKILPYNPNKPSIPEDIPFLAAVKSQLVNYKFSIKLPWEIITNGIRDVRMIIRWLLLGIVIASIIRILIPAEHFSEYFGPTLLGLGMTIIMATIMEVCSEGSVPVAADIFNRAHAPGNSFAFLMTGVSTDYTEILILRQTTGSWKIAFFLPLITTPQIALIAWIINLYT